MPHDPEIMEVYYARNSYNSRVKAAAGFKSGARIDNLKHDEKRFRRLLWEHREEIAILIHATQASLLEREKDK